MVWTVELVVIGATLLLWAGCYRRLVPIAHAAT
jgi:hypothetical protein